MIAWILVGLGVACTIPTLIVSIVPGIWETAPFHIRLVAAQGPAALLAGAATLILRRALAGHF